MLVPSSSRFRQYLRNLSPIANSAGARPGDAPPLLSCYNPRRCGMQITVNGESKTYEQPLTITELLTQFDLHPLRVAVEVNEQLVRRAEYAATRIKDGDRIEVVTFVGGG